MNPDDIKRAAVIGTGQMGPGIAYALASAGCDVTLVGRSRESLRRGINSLQRAVDLLSAESIITARAAQDILNRVKGSTDLESSVEGADLITESIVEDLKTKQDLFSAIEKICTSRALLTSNTSGLPTTHIAGALKRPERFAATHFWNPPHLMPLVEVVKGERTSPETVELLVELLLRAGKKPVAVHKDTPGQLGNRLFHAVIREGAHIVQQGIASVEDVDMAVRYGFGRRFPVYGMLEHQDAVGLDMAYAIQSYMCKSLCNDTEPAKIFRDRVAAGNLGVKTGRGFYDWTRRDIRSVLEKRDRFLIRLLKSEKEESD